MFGLLDPSIPASEKARLISNERLLELQLSVNPPEALALTEDKLEFFRRCEAHALPTARVIAIAGVRPQPTTDVPLLSSAADWRSLLASIGAECFILKPVDGFHGDGVTCFCWDGDSLTRRGQQVDIEVIHDELCNAHPRAWLLQKRLCQHKDLRLLSDTEYLQTIRVVTVVKGTGEVCIPFSNLRVIAGDAIVDNFHFGSSGNLLASLDVETGRVISALGPAANGVTLSAVECHPVTGIPLESFAVPFWSEALDLARKAALSFQPLCTVGWDIAVCDTGPVLVEGNAFWDPGPTACDLQSVASLLKQLANGMKTKSGMAKSVGGDE